MSMLEGARSFGSRVFCLVFALTVLAAHGALSARAQPAQRTDAAGSHAQPQASPEQKRSIEIIYQRPDDPEKTDHIAEARMKDGRRVIYVDQQRWNPLSEAVKDFIYHHEVGHHVLRHVREIEAAGGVIDPQTRRQQETEADCYAAHTFAARPISDQIKEVLAFIDTQPAGEHWRKDNIQACFDNTLYKPPGQRDANALSYLILDKINPEFNTDGDPALLSYQAIYRNGGRVPLQCEVTIGSGHVPREPVSNDPSTWRPFETQTDKFTIMPDERHMVHGFFTWFRIIETMPRIRIPKPSVDTEYVNCAFAPSAAVPPKPTVLDVHSALPKLIEASRNGFASLLGPISAEERTYGALLLLPDADECTVTIQSRQEPEHHCLLKGTNDRQVLNRQYQDVVKRIKAWLPEGWEAEEGLDSSHEKEFNAKLKNDEYDNGPHINVYLTTWDDDSSKRGKYQLNVLFFGSWGDDFKSQRH